MIQWVDFAFGCLLISFGVAVLVLSVAEAFSIIVGRDKK